MQAGEAQDSRDSQCLSRKEKLAQWKAEKQAAGDRTSRKAAPRQGHTAAVPGPRRVLSSKARNTDGHGQAQGVKTGATIPGNKRKFQIDVGKVQDAGASRVGPGTPIHSLQKRLRRTQPPRGQCGGQPRNDTEARGQKTAVASGKGRQVQGKGGGARSNVGSRVAVSMDTATLKKTSAFLKSQISEANMLLEIAGIDAARALMAGLIAPSSGMKGIGELALYWAARAKIEEDAGDFAAVRRILDEGQAFIAVSTQQKVLTRVVAAFEARMETRAAADVDTLLTNLSGSSHGGSGSIIAKANTSHDNSGSPLSATPYRYDPNDLSMEEDGSSSTSSSAIKALNFAKASGARTSTSGGSGISPADGLYGFMGSMYDIQEQGGGSQGAGTSSYASSRVQGRMSLSGVSVFSDDDDEEDACDLDLSDIDPTVLARAKLHEEEDEEGKGHRLRLDSGQKLAGGSVDGSSCSSKGRKQVSIVTEASPQEELGGARREGVQRRSTPHPVRQARRTSKGPSRGEASAASVGQDKTNTVVNSMAPPPPRRVLSPADSTASSGSGGGRRRKGTPHPGTRKKVAARTKRVPAVDGPSTRGSPMAGSFMDFTQVASAGKKGERKLTPVRRSRRLSSNSRSGQRGSGSPAEPTPSPLRREMEALLR